MVTRHYHLETLRQPFGSIWVFGNKDGLRAGSHFNVPYRLEKYMPLANIKTVNTGGFGARLKALLDKEVEAASLLPPQIDMAKQLGLRMVIEDSFHTLWWVPETADPDDVRAYLRGLDRAEKALDAIRAMIDPSASLVRDGRRVTIAADRVVPGDIVLLEAGDRVPADVRLIRVMPNAPALVGAGMSVLALHGSATVEDERLALGLFESVGQALVLEEDLMDAVTGLSGSGPAYVCVALEALADGGVKMGLPRASAQRLAAQTAVRAAAGLLEGGRAASRWQETVLADCPPAASGIEALLRAQAGSALINAVAAATRRSRELGA